MTGMFYTPKEIEKIIDPSTGTGAFLSSAADMLSNPPAGKASCWAPVLPQGEAMKDIIQLLITSRACSFIFALFLFIVAVLFFLLVAYSKVS